MTGRAAHIFIDGHVHLHACFDLSQVLTHATANVRRAATRLGTTGDYLGCLLLTESATVDRFAELRDAHGGALGRWTIRAGSCPETVVASAAGEPSLVVVAGRQVQTRERLELLACGCAEHFGEGEPMLPVVEEGNRKARLCIVPWGFGKWGGDRGEVVRRLLDPPWGDRIVLGDNGGRLRFGAPPPLFLMARERNIPILPGTDPFPFPSHAKRVGSYGFVLHGEIDRSCPDVGILQLLTRIRTQPDVYGSLEGAMGFLWNQCAINLRNRILKRA